MNELLLPARGRTDVDFRPPNPFPLSPPLSPFPLHDLWDHDWNSERFSPHGIMTERRRRRREGLMFDGRLPHPFIPGPFW